MNSIGYFEIQSSNPEREVTFYSSIFGWKFVKNEAIPFEYYSIETSTITGGLLKRPVKIPPLGFGTNAYVCSIQVSNFDEIAEKIIKLGGQVALEKMAVPGKCWQGYFLDQDQNTFGIYQMDSNAK